MLRANYPLRITLIILKHGVMFMYFSAILAYGTVNYYNFKCYEDY